MSLSAHWYDVKCRVSPASDIPALFTAFTGYRLLPESYSFGRCTLRLPSATIILVTSILGLVDTDTYTPYLPNKAVFMTIIKRLGMD